MITTEGQIMSSGKRRMILLFNWTILQGDGHCLEEFFNFERRRINNDQSQHSSTEEKQEKEKREGLVKNKMVGIEGKKGLCQCYRLFRSSCDVWQAISYQ